MPLVRSGNPPQGRRRQQLKIRGWAWHLEVIGFVNVITDVQRLSCFFQPLDANFRNITGDSPKPLEQFQRSGPVCLSYTTKSCAQSKVAVTSRAHINVGIKPAQLTDLSIKVESSAV